MGIASSSATAVPLALITVVPPASATTAPLTSTIVVLGTVPVLCFVGTICWMLLSVGSLEAMESGDSRVDGCHNKVEGGRSYALLTFSLKYENVLLQFQTLDGG
jgi:hypothetical protein